MSSWIPNTGGRRDSKPSRFIWVANSGSGTVTKLRATDGTQRGTFPVSSAPPAPLGLAFDGANIWVANAGTDSVTKL